MKYSIILSLLIAVLLSACENRGDFQTEGEYLYLESADAVMPVWVTGNLESGIFIITNHGGPGTVSGHTFHRFIHSFQELEKKYALVYWDQRMSGLAKGDPTLESLSVQQHVDDLDNLVTLIQTRYNPQSLFMYGHSWGGGLTLEYLGQGRNQDAFNGFIDEDGSIEDSIEQVWKRDWILPRAEAKLAETGDSYWEEVIQWYEDNPFPTEADEEPYQYVAALGGYIYDREAAAALDHVVGEGEMIFRSPRPLGWYTTNYRSTEFMEFYTFEESAKRITIPSLLIWGKEDGAVPIIASEYVDSLLATPDEDRYLVQVDECGHSVHYEKPFIWYDNVEAFIEKYK